MAIIVRQPPSVSDSNNFRAREEFDRQLWEQHKLAGTRTIDLPSVSSGAQTSFTVTVPGARANKQQTVEYGLPSAWNTGLRIDSAFVSADDTVTIVVGNPTGSPIDMGSATYSVRVRP